MFQIFLTYYIITLVLSILVVLYAKLNGLSGVWYNKWPITVLAPLTIPLIVVNMIASSMEELIDRKANQ